MTWWNYLLLVNIYLTLFYGFYALLLRRETFFQLNRIYLVGAALLSFFIPLVQSDWIKDLFITKKVQYAVYGTGSEINITAFAPIENSAYTFGEILVMLYLAGVVVLALRLMWQFVQLRRVIKQTGPSVPYSFFNKINVDDDTEAKDVILAHEEVHAQQWHSADVLIIEAVMILNWFNPVVYLYRFSIRHIHEYIADRQAIQAGNNKAEYALLLLSHTFNTPAHQLVNPFYNHSLLKQRIMMLQKNKSQRIKLLKYGLSAPLFILMLVLSSATISNSKAVTSINRNAEELFLTPADSIGTTASPETYPNANRLIALEKDSSVGDSTKGKVYSAVDTQPTFPGGEAGFAAYLAKNIRYPKAARDNKIQGRVVMGFVVEKDGTLSGIKVIRSVEHSVDAEAIRVLKGSPKWVAGSEKGSKVRVQYAIPINFALSDEPGDKAKKTGKADQSGKAVQKIVFSEVEQLPGFPGGNAAFAKYLTKTIRYPADARRNKIQGRVITSFIVREDGSISDVQVLNGIGHGADEEAIRVVKAMPKWYPGMQNGHPVNVKYTVPINFALSGKQLNLLGKTDRNLIQPVDQTVKVNTIKTDGGKTFIELKGKNKPLYIVDGKEVDGLETLKPDDIESINVLKDAGATTIYGDKGKNGVILVTLKKAK
ncbi:hypothetical protein A0256_03485 [Mucilaginibacter sp. PAMC 26640]|nr:hypothetical protein A0256_03485 [Mucilaginibacter sp. PAMC 26640]